MKKGRHRRYEEARALKRGSDLDIESIFSDLSDERASIQPDGPRTDGPDELDDGEGHLDDELIEDELEQR